MNIHCIDYIYRKILKISPGAYIFQRPFLRGLFLEGLIFGGAYLPRGLSTEGFLHFKIDWASLIVGSKFTILFLALFYFVFASSFPRTSPQGAYIWRGDLTEVFLCYRFGGLIFGGAYTWRAINRKLGLLKHIKNYLPKSHNELFIVGFYFLILILNALV